MIRRAVRAASLAGGVALAASSVVLCIDAPVGDLDDGNYDPTRRHDSFPEWFQNVGRLPVIVLGTAAAKFHLNVLNKTTVESADTLVTVLNERPRYQPVVTVSNHASTVDDPVTFAIMLPWSFTLPWKTRWSIVSQEYAYTKGLPLRWFFFAAKGLPIKRGGGIDQPMLKSLFEKVQRGDWVHVYPEGKIEQRAVLGGRTGPGAEKLGRLKWGVAKLIARADIRPIVIPFYFVNMQKIMPQGENNKLRSMLPSTGAHVKLRVGKPLNLDDIFEKHADCRIVGSQAPWETQEKEKALYAAITRRLEDALLELADGFYKSPNSSP